MLTLRYRMLLPMALLVSLSGPGRSGTAPEDNQPLRWNAPAERSECPVGDTAVWSRYGGGEDCIRYFAGGNVNNAALAMVFFRGDRVDWARLDPATVPRNSVRAQQAYAAHLSKRFGLPVIVVARPGTFGSSGNHFQRRQPSEFFALDKALDEIRARHHIGRFILVGQSGGATAVAALLTLGRTDIACAVLTSGAYNLLPRAEFLRQQNGNPSRPGRDTTGLESPYDPLAHIEGIASDKARLITIIGSPDDRLTPFRYQKEFADAVSALGHRVRLLEHAAPPPLHHSLDIVGMEAGAECARDNLHGKALDTPLPHTGPIKPQGMQ